MGIEQFDDFLNRIDEFARRVFWHRNLGRK
jgi:hypothetical protein